MYDTHAVKQDPVSQAIAVRTIFPEDGPRAWLTFALNQRSDYVTADSVADWTDLEAKT